MGIEEKVGKGLKTVKQAGDYIAPYRYVPFNEHLEQTKNHKDVKKIFDDTDPKYHKDLEDRLKYHLEITRKENRRLKYFGATADTLDKALVPIDIVADSAGILAGIGYAISVGKEILELPIKLANSLYYAKKTKEYSTPIKDLGYEVLSFIVPGSLLDLTNRYANRVDKYVAKETARRFVKEIEHYKKHKKKQNLVDITEEFKEAA